MSHREPAPSPAAAGLVDWSIPLEQVDGDREVLREIVEAYRAEICENLELLPALIDSGDATETRRRAHTLKGALRLFGAAEAQALALELEERAAKQELDGAEDLYARTREATLRVLPELERFIASGELPV